MHDTLQIIRKAKLIKGVWVRIKEKAKEDIMVGIQSLRPRCSLFYKSKGSFSIADAGPGALGT